MKLIPEWRQAWKLKSIQWSVIGLVLTGVVEFLNSIWYSLPPAIIDKIPHSSTISMAMFVVVIIMRLVKQKDTPDGSK